MKIQLNNLQQYNLKQVSFGSNNSDQSSSYAKEGAAAAGAGGGAAIAAKYSKQGAEAAKRGAEFAEKHGKLFGDFMKHAGLNNLESAAGKINKSASFMEKLPLLGKHLGNLLRYEPIRKAIAGIAVIGGILVFGVQLFTSVNKTDQ